jgi:hypothetical protein
MFGRALSQDTEQTNAIPYPSAQQMGRAASGKWLAGLLGVVLVGAVLSPIAENWRREPEDGFPLSYYPMFTAERGETSSVTHLVGVDGRGNQAPLPYTFAGTGGLNQVRRQISRIVSRGGADTLCRTVASRVARADRPPFDELVTVRIVTATHDLDDYFTGRNKGAVAERVRAECRVGRERR